MMLEIENLNVFYGDLHIIQDVSMHVNDGETVSLIGANGAGKSTLLRTVSSIKKASSGQIRFMGEDITKCSPAQIVERGLVQIPEGRRLFAKMTVYENLELGAFTKGAKKNKSKNLEYVYEMLPDLKEKAKQNAGDLSGGQQQMLAIGRGLMSDPKMLILDEPSIGLSPILTAAMFEIVSKIKKDGRTIVIVEQNVQNALMMADRGYVLEQGRIALEGPAQELLNNKELQKSYLGM